MLNLNELNLRVMSYQDTVKQAAAVCESRNCSPDFIKRVNTALNNIDTTSLRTSWHESKPAKSSKITA